jgi:hypothetical protein
MTERRTVREMACGQRRRRGFRQVEFGRRGGLGSYVLSILFERVVVFQGIHRWLSGAELP